MRGFFYAECASSHKTNFSILNNHVERDLNKCYNINMNDLGLLAINSASSVYSAGTVYPAEITSVKAKQSTSAEQIPATATNSEIVDETVISDAAKNLLTAEKTDNQKQPDSQLPQNATASKDPETENTKNQTISANEELTQAEKETISKLKVTDANVKAHEQAHLAAAAGLNASAPAYSYEKGPDGNKYAVGGEVSISFSISSDPESNLKKAEKLKAAALAPSDPSAQDRAVARNAEQMIAQAKQEIAAEKQENAKDAEQTTESTKTTDTEATDQKATGTENAKTKDDNQPKALDNKTLTELIFA